MQRMVQRKRRIVQGGNVRVVDRVCYWEGAMYRHVLLQDVRGDFANQWTAIGTFEEALR
jgi:hypothetical protein